MEHKGKNRTKGNPNFHKTTSSPFSSKTVLLWEKRKALKRTVAWWRLFVHAIVRDSDDFLLRTWTP